MSAVLWASFLMMALAACAEGERPPQCLEHYQTEYGNQTKWVRCPARVPHSPWRHWPG